MSLKILSGSDPVSIDTVTILVYGEPGSGKTSLAFTADDPLLLDFDRGAYRSAFRGDSVPVDAWADVDSMAAKDLEPYSTIVVDTAGRCVDVMALDIMRDNPKMRGPAGQLTLQGWGVLKARFAAWMRELRSYGKDVVLVAHGVESRDGDDLILRPDISGGSYGEIFKLADGVAYLRMSGSKRMLSWDPMDRAVGKNPAGLPPQEVPHLSQDPEYLAGILSEIKSAIGQISAQGKAVRETVDSWRTRLDKITTAKTLTKVLGEAKDDLDGAALVQVKALVAERMKDLGFRWDRDSDSFVEPEKEAA